MLGCPSYISDQASELGLSLIETGLREGELLLELGVVEVLLRVLL